VSEGLISVPVGGRSVSDGISREVDTSDGRFVVLGVVIVSELSTLLLSRVDAAVFEGLMASVLEIEMLCSENDFVELNGRIVSESVICVLALENETIVDIVVLSDSEVVSSVFDVARVKVANPDSLNEVIVGEKEGMISVFAELKTLVSDDKSFVKPVSDPEEAAIVSESDTSIWVGGSEVSILLEVVAVGPSDDIGSVNFDEVESDS